ncbi:MAG: hypothetical protein H7Z14_13185 [Anaerolineae bacterium]|nr:hypothetical protein [Phycisphaerae bacterium]
MTSSRKWLKRLILLVALAMVILLGSAIVVMVMVRSKPDFYRPLQFTAAQRADAAKSAEDKFIQIQNSAARNQAVENAQRRRVATSASTGPIVFNGEPVTIMFTEAELNAFFDKWSSFQNWKSGYENYIEEPALILRDGRVILAAKLKDPNLVISLHFEPSIDEKGQLKLELARILGGVMPLPEAMIGKYQEKLTSNIARRLPMWQQSADIDAGGAANSNAIAASAAKLLVRMLRHESAEPVLFLPVFGQKGSVPVKVQAVGVTDGEMTVTIQPMKREEQTALLQRIRAPEPVHVDPVTSRASR